MHRPDFTVQVGPLCLMWTSFIHCPNVRIAYAGGTVLPVLDLERSPRKQRRSILELELASSSTKIYAPTIPHLPHPSVQTKPRTNSRSFAHTAPDTLPPWSGMVAILIARCRSAYGVRLLRWPSSAEFAGRQEPQRARFPRWRACRQFR